MIKHDPKRVIEDLRNQLAAYDKRLIFLFGAGASSSVNIANKGKPISKEKKIHVPLIPGIEGLTEICAKAVKSIGTPQANAWAKLEDQCEQDNRPANVENILSKIRMKIDAIGEGEELLGLNLKQLSEVEETICAAIGEAVCPTEDKIPEEIPHDYFAAWIKKANRIVPIEIFTTNYDLLFERSFEAARVPIFDGFVGTYNPFFAPECVEDDDLRPKAKWINLWKLHGSVNWHIKESKKGQQVVRGSPIKSGEMILPSHRKYDQSRKQPYMAYMDRLTRVMNSEHVLLITCGYNFGDEHINAILYGALDYEKTTNIVALRFNNLQRDDEIVKIASQYSNFSVIGPNAGIISGTWGEWLLSQPIDNRTCSFMDIGFDCNAQPEDVSSPAEESSEMKGKIRLGDFNWFCRFLHEMGGGIH